MERCIFHSTHLASRIEASKRSANNSQKVKRKENYETQISVYGTYIFVCLVCHGNLKFVCNEDKKPGNLS